MSSHRGLDWSQIDPIASYVLQHVYPNIQATVDQIPSDKIPKRMYFLSLVGTFSLRGKHLGRLVLNQEEIGHHDDLS